MSHLGSIRLSSACSYDDVNLRYSPHWSVNPAHYLFEMPRTPFVFLTRTPFVLSPFIGEVIFSCCRACRNHVVERVEIM